MLHERLGTPRRPLRDGDVILDIPPRDKDRLPRVDVRYGQAPGGAVHAPLADTSRIVSGIGEDFLAAVKKIRLFVHPDHAERLSTDRPRVAAMIDEVLSEL